MTNQPFFQVTLPLMLTFIVSIWWASHSQNKRFEDFKEYFNKFQVDLGKRLDKIEGRLDKIEGRLNGLELTKWR